MNSNSVLVKDRLRCCYAHVVIVIILCIIFSYLYLLDIGLSQLQTVTTGMAADTRERIIKLCR